MNHSDQTIRNLKGDSERTAGFLNMLENAGSWGTASPVKQRWWNDIVYSRRNLI